MFHDNLHLCTSKGDAQIFLESLSTTKTLGWSDPMNHSYVWIGFWYEPNSQTFASEIKILASSENKDFQQYLKFQHFDPSNYGICRGIHGSKQSCPLCHTMQVVQKVKRQLDQLTFKNDLPGLPCWLLVGFDPLHRYIVKFLLHIGENKEGASRYLKRKFDRSDDWKGICSELSQLAGQTPTPVPSNGQAWGKYPTSGEFLPP